MIAMLKILDIEDILNTVFKMFSKQEVLISLKLLARPIHSRLFKTVNKLLEKYCCFS